MGKPSLLAESSPDIWIDTGDMPNILITGASSGLGAALACAYAEPGSNLLLFGRNRQRLDDTAALCRQRGATVDTVSLDIRNIEPLMLQLREADARMPIDLAILNAGLGGIADIDRISERPERSYEMSLVNFVSPVVAATVVGELMGARGRGRIVIVGSLAEAFPLPMAPTYSGTKAGLAMFAVALELRLMKHGVGVTLVSPGFIDTPMSRSVPPPKPFLMTATDAAAIIRRKVASGSRRLVLPWQFALILTLTRWVPRALTRAVLRRL
jgi:short-subunit dehydrogenase